MTPTDGKTRAKGKIGAIAAAAHKQAITRRASRIIRQLPLVVLPDDIHIESFFTSDESVERKETDEELLAKLEAELLREIDEELAHEEREKAKILTLPRIYILTGCVTTILLSVLLFIGWNYYTLPLVSRPLHYFHQLLRPSGYLGLTLGVAGTGLIFASLLYLVRKQLVSWPRLGPLRAWLGFHIFTGLMGPALVLFHAAFVPHSALGLLALCSMLVVVCTGVLGRYIYVHAPRSLEGRELELEVVRGRLIVYRSKLIQLGLDPSLIAIGSGDEDRRSPWLLTAIVRVITGDRQSRTELARLTETIKSRHNLQSHIKRILPLARRLCRERQWLVRYQELRKVMGAWRFLHRWLAVIMVAAIVFHVLMAYGFGNLWIFGGGGH